MINYCPNCNKEFAPDDKRCSNCGLERPQAIHKMPTTILSQRPNGSPSEVVAAQPLETPTPIPVESPLVPTELDTAATDEPPLPGFWICGQCQTANPTGVDYCENCGALNPGSLPTERQAQPGIGDTTSKLSLEDIAALSAVQKPTGWQLVSGNATDAGVSRKGHTNEDSHFTLELRRSYEGQLETFGFYIVADGMGGQAAGEIASRLAIESVAPIMVGELAGRWISGEKIDPDEVTQTLHTAVSLAHNRLRQFNISEGIDSGTTLTACCILSPWAIFANVGDSRTYLFRQPETLPGEPTLEKAPTPDPDAPTEPIMVPSAELIARPPAERVIYPAELPQTDDLKTNRLYRRGVEANKPQLIIERVTRDQSLVQHLMEKGEITADEMYSDPRRNVILSALGAPDDVPVDTYKRELKEGDTILLCSDGLWEMVRDNDIAQRILEHPDLQICADSLVNLANDNGGADNVSVVLVRYQHPGGAA